jgi:hypothetical protein
MTGCCSRDKGSNDTSVDLENLDGLICYCFNKSKKELFEAVKNGSENLIVDDIKSKIKNPGCFCETANPSGRCCLSDINAFIKAVKSTKQ